MALQPANTNDIWAKLIAFANAQGVPLSSDYLYQPNALIGAYNSIVQRTYGGTAIGPLAPNEADSIPGKLDALAQVVSPTRFPTLTITASPTLVCSVIRTTGWAGACLQVRRSSDDTTLDIGFVNNVVDWAAADAFAAGSSLFITKWYDQSGNANDLAQATAANQPTFNRASHVNGVRGITSANVGGSGLAPLYLFNNGLTQNTNAFALYLAMSPRTSYTIQSHATCQDTTATTDYVNLFHGGNLFRFTLQGLGTTQTTFDEFCQLDVMSITGGAASFMDLNGVQTTKGAAANQAWTRLQLGNSVTATIQGYGDYFFVALYPAAHTAAALTAYRTNLLAGFGIQPAYSKNLVFNGTSHALSVGATQSRSVPRIAGFGRSPADNGFFQYDALPEWELHNLGVFGRSLTSEASAYTSGNAAATFKSNYKKNIFVMGNAVNTISTATYTSVANMQSQIDTLYTSTFLTYLATVKATGFTVLVPTQFPNTTYALGSGNFREDARRYMNQKIRDGALLYGYTVIDWAMVSPFIDANYSTIPANTTYYTDGVHLTDYGYRLIAGPTREAILAA